MRQYKPLEKAIIKSLLDYTQEDGYVLVNELLSKRFYTSPRTTLTEKIKPLIREGLVQQIWVDGQHGKRRAYRLTPSVEMANNLKRAGIDMEGTCFYRNHVRPELSKTNLEPPESDGAPSTTTDF